MGTLRIYDKEKEKWKNISAFKGDKGDPGEKGDPGYTPQKNIDYFDGEKGQKGDKGDSGVYVGNNEPDHTRFKIWIIPNGSPSPKPPIIANGYWQFKETTPYKYVIIGTDDSTSSDPYFYRLLRSYGFKYTCNVIADVLDRRMASDVVDGFTSDDAPSLFSSAPTTREFLALCKDRDDIEFALHGTSAEHLLDTRKATDDLWNTYYADYTSKGGTRTLDDFKSTVMENVADYDIAQGCPYVERSRRLIEEIIGKPVVTCGIWGGVASVTVDEIEITMSELDSKSYDWKENGYTALGHYLVGQYTPSYATKPSEDYMWRLQRDSGGIWDFTDNFNRMNVGDCIEIFHHFTNSADIADHKQALSIIKEYVDNGKAKVVTRKEYAELGEYVSNPIVSIHATRTSNTISVGDTDSKSEYTVVATYLDGTTANVLDESIVEVIADTSEARIVKVGCYYRGFSNFVSVEVKGDSSKILEPYIYIDTKLVATNGGLGVAKGAKVYRYDVSGLDKIYFDSTHNHGYIVGWDSNELSINDTTSIIGNPYYNPINNPNEILVPDGMNYLYINSLPQNGYDVYPWTISRD